MNEAGRVFRQVVAGGGKGASPAAAAEPPVLALAALVLEESLAVPQIMEHGRGRPDGGEGCFSDVAAAHLDEGAWPDIPVRFDVDEAASG